MRKRSINNASRFYLVWTVLTSRELRRPGLRLLGTIIYYFFLLQFQTVLRPKRRPVVNVDHPLDREIPFCPEDVGTYLSFISLWMKSLSFFRRAGGRAVNPQAAEYMEGLRRLYKEAGLVYDQCQSTTRRPRPGARPLFIVIHLFDPHLHCIPSLHVGVVLYNWFMMKKLLGGDAWEAEGEVEYACREALAIIDTILTIKQHSINCVASGLFFLNALFPGEFSREDCRQVIAGLLADREDQIPRLGEIRRYVEELFESFCKTCDSRLADPKAVLVDFLRNYAPAEAVL